MPKFLNVIFMQIQTFLQEVPEADTFVPKC